jgi:hypothetical protein
MGDDAVSAAGQKFIFGTAGQELGAAEQNKEGIQKLGTSTVDNSQRAVASQVNQTAPNASDAGKPEDDPKKKGTSTSAQQTSDIGTAGHL